MKLNLPLFFGNGGKKRKEDLAYRITEISIKLKDQQDKLDEAMRRLKERDRELFDKAVRSQMNGETARATIYAQEISDIRKMMKTMYTAYLAIEKVRLKLDTVQELQGVSLVLLPVAKILGDLKEHIRGLAPEVAIALDSITSSVNSIAVETGAAVPDRTLTPALDEQARKILDEAQRTAEAKVKEMLPDLQLPHPPANVDLPSPPTSKETNKFKNRITEKDILNIITSHGNVLDINFISRQFGMDKEEVMSLLKTMAEKGLIALEE